MKLKEIPLLRPCPDLLLILAPLGIIEANEVIYFVKGQLVVKRIIFINISILWITYFESDVSSKVLHRLEINFLVDGILH